MRLPNADRAVINERKVRDYLLSRSHPVGRFKAAFLARLGFGQDNSQLLVQGILQIARTNQAQVGQPSKYGQKYLVFGELTGPSGSAKVVTVLAVPNGDDIPRLVTVYPE